MDFVLGCIAMLIAVGIVYVVVRAVRRSRANSQSESASSAPSLSFSSSERRDQEVEKPKSSEEVLYDQLYNTYHSSSTKEEYETLLQDIKSKQHRLYSEGFNELTSMVNDEITRLDEEAAAQAAIDLKVEKFRALKSVMDSEELFTELHRIYVIRYDDEEDAATMGAIISYEDLEEYGEQSDLDWLAETYDKLLVERFRTLLEVARVGTVADYKKVQELREELKSNDYTDVEGEDVDVFLTNNLTSEWNEMIVRFKRELDWYEDLMGLDNLDEDAYKVIIKKAREDKDFMSLRLLIMMIDEDVSELKDLFIETLITELRTELDVQFLSLGFKSGEEERSA